MDISYHLINSFQKRDEINCDDYYMVEKGKPLEPGIFCVDVDWLNPDTKNSYLEKLNLKEKGIFFDVDTITGEDFEFVEFIKTGFNKQKYLMFIEEKGDPTYDILFEKASKPSDENRWLVVQPDSEPVLYWDDYLLCRFEEEEYLQYEDFVEFMVYYGKYSLYKAREEWFAGMKETDVNGEMMEVYYYNRLPDNLKKK